MARSLDKVLAKLPAKRRAKIERRARELAMLKAPVVIRNLAGGPQNPAGRAVKR